MKKITIGDIKGFKNKKPITMITGYDYLFAKLFDSIIDIILVGDSLNMSFNGKKDTLSISLDNMIYHTNAVCEGAKNSLVVLDMPFGTYTNKHDAINNSIKVYKETQADAIKLEGGSEKADIVEHLTNNSIAVMGHIGLMPQFVRCDGGYKVKGKDELELKKLIQDAKDIESAGAFCLVLEGVKADIAKEVTNSVNIPVIGIGAGLDVDGQVLVWSDMLGFFDDFKPKFVKRYLNGAELVREAVKQYVSDVENRVFPSNLESY